ncbi:MAG: hypothetical protein J5846_11255 [Desulfovibrio sp.]|nr:hypothetical protein [Desulfovibrio sp.]
MLRNNNFDERNTCYDESYHDGGHIADRNVAMRMLQRNYPLDDISDITGLTKEKLFELHERVRIKAQNA